MLAGGAEVRPPASHHDAPDGRLAAAAGLAGPQVDIVPKLKESALPLRVYIIRNGGPAQLDGVAQHLLQRLAQPFQFGAGEAARPAPRTDSGTKQALVGIDIAHPGQKPLVEQRRFDRKLAAAKERRKFLRSDAERLGAWTFKSRGAAQVAKFQPAEAASVYKTEFPAAGQGKPCVSVRLKRRVGGGGKQSAGHAQVNDPLRVDCVSHPQFAHNVLAGAMDREETPAFESFCLLRRRRLKGFWMAAEPDLNHAVSAHALIHAASDGFHFRKLRHELYCRRPDAGLERLQALAGMLEQFFLIGGAHLRSTPLLQIHEAQDQAE